MNYRLCCVLWLSAALPCGAAFPGYLPRGGPTPLRFMLPAPVLAQASLPPLVVTPPDPAPPPTNAPPPAPTVPPPISLPADAQTAPPVAPEQKAQTMPEAGPPPPPPPGFAVPDHNSPALITPRSLLQYFLPGQDATNSPAYMIPMGFAPPLPSAPPSSSATYNSPPGPTPPSISTKP